MLWVRWARKGVLPLELGPVSNCTGHYHHVDSSGSSGEVAHINSTHQYLISLIYQTSHIRAVSISKGPPRVMLIDPVGSGNRTWNQSDAQGVARAWSRVYESVHENIRLKA